MPYKNRQTQLLAQKQHYKDNKQTYLVNQKRRRRKTQDWLVGYKKTLKCTKCPESRPICLDFHHINPKEKDRNISKMCMSGYNLERIKREITKCVVLCSNCHRVEHERLKKVQ